jgi:hypothetical protein
MKKLLTLLTLLPSLAFAQLTTINPDTVCYQTGGSIYEVTPTAGLIYTWGVVAPGTITGGQGTNQIQVDWSAAAPGLIPGAIQVQASNNIGCLSPIVTLDVFIYNVNVTYVQITDICENSPCIPLVGFPNGGTWSGTLNNEFCPPNPGLYNLIYTYTNAGCTFVNAMQINVLPLPMLLPIEHN